jgi:hypothetical protein
MRKLKRNGHKGPDGAQSKDASRALASVSSKDAVHSGRSLLLQHWGVSFDVEPDGFSGLGWKYLGPSEITCADCDEHLVLICNLRRTVRTDHDWAVYCDGCEWLGTVAEFDAAARRLLRSAAQQLASQKESLDRPGPVPEGRPLFQLGTAQIVAGLETGEPQTDRFGTRIVVTREEAKREAGLRSKSREQILGALKRTNVPVNTSTVVVDDILSLLNLD